MTRTTAREIAVHLAYEMGYSDCSAEQFLEEKLNRDYFASMAEAEELYREFPDKEQLAYIRQVIEGVGRHGYELDSDIERYAKGWKFSRIPRVAAAIMRVAMYEILYMPEVPNGAAINEAVEIAKCFGGETSGSFVDGVLGKIASGRKDDAEEHKAPVRKEHRAKHIIINKADKEKKQTADTAAEVE